MNLIENNNFDININLFTSLYINLVSLYNFKKSHKQEELFCQTY